MRCLGVGAVCDCSNSGGCGILGVAVFEARAINRAGRRVGGGTNPLRLEFPVLCLITRAKMNVLLQNYRRSDERLEEHNTKQKRYEACLNVIESYRRVLETDFRSRDLQLESADTVCP